MRRRFRVGSGFSAAGDAQKASGTCGPGDSSLSAGWPIPHSRGKRCLTHQSSHRIRSGNLETKRGRSINLLGNGPQSIPHIPKNTHRRASGSRTLSLLTGNVLVGRSWQALKHALNAGESRGIQRRESWTDRRDALPGGKVGSGGR